MTPLKHRPSTAQPKRYVEDVDEEGNVTFTQFKCWRKDSGYRSFATLDDVRTFAKRENVTRVDMIVTTILPEDAWR